MILRVSGLVGCVSRFACDVALWRSTRQNLVTYLTVANDNSVLEAQVQGVQSGGGLFEIWADAGWPPDAEPRSFPKLQCACQQRRVPTASTCCYLLANLRSGGRYGEKEITTLQILSTGQTRSAGLFRNRVHFPLQGTINNLPTQLAIASRQLQAIDRVASSLFIILALTHYGQSRSRHGRT